MFWIILTVLVFVIVFKVYQNTRYWATKGITYEKPWPILGNLQKVLLKKQSFAESVQEIYNRHPDAKLIGIHQMIKPSLIIRDPSLIKEVCIKNFDSFHDHTVTFTEEIEPLLGKNLLSLTGSRWKAMRTTLTPAFTGHKMKQMHHLIKACSAQFVHHFIDKAEKRPIHLEMLDVFTKFTNDVIATCAFGIECNSLQDDNEFYTLGKKITYFGLMANLRFMASMAFPWLKIGLFPRGVTGYFREIIQTTLKTRAREGIIRPDMIHLLMEAREAANESTLTKGLHGNEPEATLTDDDITAQALLFFFAGYETTSVMMSYLAYELAINPQVQEKLQEEVGGADLSYDDLLKLPYLDQVVSESLRKWPPQAVTERICTVPCSLFDKTIEKGTTIWMPVYALHHDERYFEEPQKFDPERFNEENKKRIQPFTYLPFGAGPRNCIGSRFALLVVKTLMADLLRRFDIVPVERTKVPMRLNKGQFSIRSEEGVWLGFKLRTIEN